MHTVLVVCQGFLLLLVFLWVASLATPAESGRRPRHRYLACRTFIVVWLVVAAVNLWLGVEAGDRVVDELRLFGIVFGLPAATAAWVGQRALRSIDA